MERHGLKINANKCEFGKQELDFLGHQIDKNGIAPITTKVSAIRDYELPKTIKDLGRFLGMLNFYRRFVKQTATTLATLYDLLVKYNKLPKSKVMQWEPQQLQSFDNAKNALADVTNLAYPIPNAQLILAADANDVAVEAVVHQQDTEGNITPVGFFSRRLDKRQQKFSTFSRELLAVYLGVCHFRTTIEFRHVVINTDHMTLVHSARKCRREGNFGGNRTIDVNCELFNRMEACPRFNKPNSRCSIESSTANN